jgi:hypothetical protein
MKNKTISYIRVPELDFSLGNFFRAPVWFNRKNPEHDFIISLTKDSLYLGGHDFS